MRRLFIYCLLLAAAMAHDAALAQDNFKFGSYTVDDGLPQSSIWSIIQDRNGFLWVGTSDGLCRFDGYDFKVFRASENDSNSISGKSNMHFFEDEAGNIWIAHDRGISKYDIGTNSFVNVFRYKVLPQNPVFNRILGQDKDGYIWAGTVGNGLLKIDAHANKVLESYPITESKVTESPMWYSGFIDSRQRIWYTRRDNGLYCFDIATHKLNKYLDIYPGDAVIPFGKTGLLMSSNDELLIFDRDTHAFTVIDQSHWSDELKLKTEAFNGVYDKKGQLWLCGERGAYVFDTAKRKVIRRFSSFSQGINNYSYCHTAYCDHSGNIWIGTNGDGLKKLMNDTKGFRTYNNHVTGGSIVKAIYVQDSVLYVGCFDNGIDKYSLDTGFITKLDRKSGFGDWVMHVYAFAKFNNDNAIVYSTGAPGCHIGLFSLRRNVYTDLTDRLIKDMPVSIYCGDEASFITNTHVGPIFNWGSSVVLLSGNSAENVHFTELHHFDKEHLNCGFEDHNGLLSVGTSVALYLQDKDNKWIKAALPGQQYVKTINEDMDGHLWVGTTSGIYVLDSRMNKVMTHYNADSGLKNEFIYGILRDNRGRMWFSHNKGLSVFDPVKKAFHHYSSEDGLQSNEFNTGAYCKLSNGRLLFGGINGVNIFDPDSVKDNPNKPPVRITGIKVFDEPLKTDTAYWYIKSLELPYNRNSFTFNFTALEFTNPHRNQYEYKMDNLDKDWIRSGEDHVARYPSLPPGQYTFMVRAANNDGVWQETPATISITIVPPVWQRWWFRIFYIMLFVGILTGINMWIQRQRHRRQIREMELQHKIQLERERISRDLHDNVGTQLSLISNNIEWVTYPLRPLSEHEKSEKLLFVSNTAKGIIATLRETIWALNKEQIALEEFSDKLKAFVHKQMTLYPQVNLDYTEQIENRIILGPSEALNLFRICQEAVANALKYANATILVIQVQSTVTGYRITVKDNGNGFDIAGVDHSLHNGLENMKYRAKDIAGTLDVQSRPGQGTVVVVSK